MTSYNFSLVMFLFILLSGALNAQPFTLDENLKPMKLALTKNADTDKEKLVITNSYMEGEAQFYYVEGHDVFDLVDIYVFSNYGNPNFKVEVVNTNWGDVIHSETTAAADDGIINIKLRAFNKFGIKVYPTTEKVNYTLAVHTNEPTTDYLGDPFVKGKKEELNPEGGNAANTGAGNSNNNEGGGGNTWLYVALGAAGLAIALLLGVILGRRKAALFWLLFLMASPYASAQQHSGNTWHSTKEYGNWLKSEARANRGGFWDDVSQVNKGLDRMGKLGTNVGKAVNTYNAANKAYKAYKDLGGCMNSVPPAGMPRVPSFCETDECNDCFRDARQRFNQNRYTFEKLKAIYKCTRNFTDAAIAFGDNVSGYHGVSGLAWQSQKGGINKSIKELVDAYDNKYAQLLESQHKILMELNQCEAEHGISDWYDRFGYLYFEFTKMNYQR